MQEINNLFFLDYIITNLDEYLNNLKIMQKIEILTGKYMTTKFDS